MALTIVAGSDNAGYGHKSALKELLEQDPASRRSSTWA